jgi:hypothetical protein
VRNNFNKPKRHWDRVESMIAGDRKKIIEQMAVDGSFVAILGDDLIYEDLGDEDEDYEET